ncbi:VCBS domain-containing protein [Candidatus Magnetaquicoccus inordinatus]|uniref:VCBS domain-containing protein n=1 Tax=Candidatus Magnetaquicoccus inordinatus TaxID=2496818 RepID=UPI00102D141A|nr:VCBS domain-containing protein [Candidatus Magnetaquicoccus inordinatus]
MSEKRLAKSKTHAAQRLQAWLHSNQARRRVTTVRPRTLFAETLEPRFLLSGEALMLPPPPVVQDPQAPLQMLKQALQPQNSVAAHLVGQEAVVARLPQDGTAKKINEIFFVDAQVKDPATLIAEALKPRAGQSETARAEVVVLDGTQDGVGQISTWLQGYQGLQAIHLLSHGDDAALRLGSTTLNAQNLESYNEQLLSWRSALAPGADLLLYGCDVGKGASGDAFIQKLAQLTGSDVAASVDATGATALGGNWLLEKQTGAIETSNPFAAFTGYRQLMVTTTPSISGSSTLNFLSTLTAKATFQAANNLGAQMDANSAMASNMPMVDLPFSGLLRTSDGRTMGDVLAFRTLKGTSVLDDFLAAGGTNSSQLMARMGDYLNGLGDYSTLESVANHAGSAITLSDDGASKISLNLTLSRQFVQTFGFGKQLEALGLDFLAGSGVPLLADIHYTATFDLAAGAIAVSKLDAQIHVVDPQFSAKMALGVMDVAVNGGILNFDTGKVEFDPITTKLLEEVKKPSQPDFTDSDILIKVKSSSTPAVLANASFDLSGTVGDTPLATIAGGVPRVNVAFGGLSITSVETNSVHPTISGVATLLSDQSLQVVVGGASGAKYLVTPAQDGTWELDFATAVPSSGTLALVSGQDVEVTAQIVKTVGGTVATSATAAIKVNPTVNTVIANTITPTLSGVAFLAANQQLSVTVGGATYRVIPDAHGAWSLNLASLGTATLTNGTLALSHNPSTPYTVTVAISGGPTLSGQLTVDTSLSNANCSVTAPAEVIINGDTVTGSVSWPALQAAPLTMTSSNFSNLQAFSSLTSTQIVNMLKDLGTYLALLRDSGSFDAVLPYTELKLGEALDFSAAINKIIDSQLATTVSSGMVASKAISPVLTQDLAFDLEVQRAGDDRVTLISIAVNKSETSNFIHINELAGLIGTKIAAAVDGWLAWKGDPVEVAESLKGGLQIAVSGNSATARSSESQTLNVHASSGSYKLSYNGSSTAAISVLASPIEVQHALENVLGVGNVQVSGRAKHYLIDFIGSKAGSDQPLLAVSDLNVTTGSLLDVTASEFRQGPDGRTWGKINLLQADPDDFTSLRLAPSSGVSVQMLTGGSESSEAMQRLFVVHGGNSSFTLQGPGDPPIFVTDPLCIYGLDPSAAQSAIANALSAKLGSTVVGLAVAEVTSDYAADNGTRIFDISFGKKADQYYAQGLLTANQTTAGVTLSESTAGGQNEDGEDVNEVQLLLVEGSRAGSYVLKGTAVNGTSFTTVPIAYNASAATIQQALRDGMGLSSLTVGGPAPVLGKQAYSITFDAKNYGLLTAANLWTTQIPAQVVVSTEQIAAPAVGNSPALNEIQRLIVSNATGGNFSMGISLDNLLYETQSIDHGASASTLQASLLTMFRLWDSSVQSSDIAVSKNGNIYDIEFKGRWSGKDLPQLRVKSTHLTTASGTGYASLEHLGFLPGGQDTQVNNVTTFVTLTEMVQRFQQEINSSLNGATFLVNPTFDLAKKSFLFNVRLTPTQTMAVPLAVSGTIGELSALHSETSLDVTAQTLFQAAIGFDFSHLNTFALRAGGTYSGKISASAKDVNATGWPAISIFGDARFNMAFNGEGYDLTLTQGAVANNQSRADLVSDLQSLFNNQQVSAGGVLARRGFAHLGQVVKVGLSDEGQLTFTINAPIDQVQLTILSPIGLSVNTMSSVLGFRTMPCYPSPKAVELPSNGRLIAGSAHFSLKVDQSEAIDLVLNQATTDNNSSIDDLINDLNALFAATSLSGHAYLGSAGKGFSNLGQVIQASLRNGQIELVTQSAKIASLQMQISGSDPATKELGFTPGQFATTTGAYVFLQDFSLDGGATYQKIILGGNFSAVIHGQSGSTPATLGSPGSATLGMLDLTFDTLSTNYNGSLQFNLRNGLNGAAHDIISLNDLFDSAAAQTSLLGLGGKVTTNDTLSSPNAPFQSNGQLLRDVGLSVTVGTTALDVTVRKAATTSNSTVADLAADVNAAIHTALTNKFTTDPYADFVFVEADSISVAGKTVLKFNAATTTLTLATTPSQIYNASNGVLAVDLPLTVVIPNSGGYAVDLQVTASNTTENSSLADLVNTIDNSIKLALASARNNTDIVAVQEAIDAVIYPVDQLTGLVSAVNGVLTLQSAVTAAPITLKNLVVDGRLLKDDYIENLSLRNQAGTANSKPIAELTFSGITVATPAGVSAAGLNPNTVITIEVSNGDQALAGKEILANSSVVPADGLGSLTPFKEVSWSNMRDDLAQLSSLFGNLGDVGAFGELGRALPLLGDSISEQFDFASRFTAVNSALAAENGIGLTALASTLEKAFGLSSGAVTLQFDASSKLLKIDLPYQVVFDKSVAIELVMNDANLLSLLSAGDKEKLTTLLGAMSRLKDVDGSALMDLHADLTFHLALGLDMDPASSNLGRLFLFDHQESGNAGMADDLGTYALINAFRATVGGIAFTSVQGIYSLGVTGGSANLLINSGSGLTLHSDDKDGANDGRLYLNRYAALGSEAATALRHADFTVIFDGSADVVLPMTLTVSDELGQLAMEQIDGFINPLPLGKMELHFINLGDSFAKIGGKSGFTLQSSAESSNSHTVISSQVQQAALPERPATGNGSAVSTPEGAPIDSVDESGLTAVNPNPYFGSTEGSGASTTPSTQTVDITKLFATGPSVNPASTGFDVSLIIPDFAYWQTQLTQVLNAAIGEKCDPEQQVNGPLIFLLRDPTIIVDTVDAILGGIQKGLDAFSSVLDLPIIGDKLREATQFVVDLRKNVVGAIKTALDDAVDVYGGLDNALRMMMFKMLEPADVNHDLIVTATEQANGNPFLNFLQDYNGDKLITPDDIVVEYLAGTGQPTMDPRLAQYMGVTQSGITYEKKWKHADGTPWLNDDGTRKTTIETIPIPAVLPGQRTAWVTSGINTVKIDSQGNQIKHDDDSLCYVGKAGYVTLDSSLQKIVDDISGTIDSVLATASDILDNLVTNHGNGFVASATAFAEFVIAKVKAGYDYQHLLTDVFGTGVIAAALSDVIRTFTPSAAAIDADAATVKYNLDHNLSGSAALIPMAVLNEMKAAVRIQAEKVALQMALGSSTAIQFRMHLGQTYNPELDLSFDIGVPGLSLELDGGIGLKLDWDLFLGFGIDIKDGFYLITNMPETAGIGQKTVYNSQGVAIGVEANGKDAHIDNLWLVGKPFFTPAVKELQAQLDVYLAPGAGNQPAQLSGKLLFLNGTLTDNWDGWIRDNDTGIWGSGTDSLHRLAGTQNANYGRTTTLFDGESGFEGSRTRLRVNFSIDIKDVGLFGISALSMLTNGRLTFADLRNAKLSDLYKVEWEAKAQINLHVQLGLSLDMSGHAKDSYLPTIMGDFHLTWQDSNKNKYVKQINQFLGSGYDKLFHVGEPNIWMSDIYLDVGTFFSQFLKPIVKVIQYVTDPIMPVIDALTAPIPGISQLMGRDYSVVDLASDMSALFGGISKLDFIIAMVNVLEVIGHLPTDTDGMLIPIKEAFIISGKRDRKLDLSAFPSIIPDKSVTLPYLTIADVHVKQDDFEFNLDMGVGWRQNTTLFNLLRGNIPNLSFDFAMSADMRIPAPYIDVTPFDFTIDGIFNRDGSIAHFKLAIKAGWPRLLLSDILNGNMAPRFDVTLIMPDIDFTPNLLPLLRVTMPKLTATFNGVEHTLIGGSEINVDWPSWVQGFVDKTRIKRMTGPTANINLGSLHDFLMPLPYVEIGSTLLAVPGFTNPFTMKAYAGWKSKWFSDFLLGGMLPGLYLEVDLPSGFNVDTRILPVIDVLLPSLPSVSANFIISGQSHPFTIGSVAAGSKWRVDWSSALSAFVDTSNVKTIDLTAATFHIATTVNFGSIDLRFLPSIQVKWPDVHWIAVGKEYIWKQTSTSNLGWSSIISDAGLLSFLVDPNKSLVLSMPDVYLPSINLWDLLPDIDWDFSLPGLPSLPSLNIDLPDINLPGKQTVSPKDGYNEFMKKMKKPGSALKFPILDDPVFTVIGMLKGQPVDLMTFTPPDLDIKVGFRISFPVYPPVYVGLGGEIRIQAALKLGFDTYGIIKYSNSNNLLDIFDGFYVGDHIVQGVDKPEITLTAKLYAFAELNAFIIRAGVEGGIKLVGTLDIYDEDMDNKYRVSELLAAISEDPLDVVEMHLRASAYVSAYVDLFAIFDYVRVWEQTFFDVTLFEWEHDPAAKKPVLGSMDGDNLVLHVGSTITSIDGQSSVEKGAKDRLRRSTNDANEAYTLTGNGGTVNISAILPNGQTYTKTFTGVNRVKAYTGDGDDLIDASALDRKVLFIAGAGNDTLKGGSADDVLIGSASGTATLIGGLGKDLFIVRGGTTHLDGGSGDDSFRFLSGWGVADITDALGDNIIDFTAQTAAVTVDDSEGKAFQAANIVTWHNGGGGSGGGDTIDLIKGGKGGDILDFSGDEAPLLISVTATNAGWVKGSGAGKIQTSFASATHSDMQAVGDNAGYGFKFEGFENIFGGQGSDVFRIKDGASLTGSLHGDTEGALHHASSGNEIANSRNILDFSEYTASVTVNEESTSAFGSASATGIIVRGFHDLFGGASSDRLSGDGRNNLLVGNNGTDLLEGKAGHDLLVADTFVTYANLTGAQARPGDANLEKVTDYLSLQKAGAGQWGAAKRNWLWKGQTLESIANTTAGSQTLKGGSGNDIILGSKGGDIINIGGSGEGNDTIMADLGKVSVDFNYSVALLATSFGSVNGISVGGNDTIYLGGGSNLVIAGNGKDSVFAADVASSFNIILGDNGTVKFKTAEVSTNSGAKLTFANVDGIKRMLDSVDAPVAENGGTGNDDTISMSSGSAIVLAGAGKDTVRFSAAASTAANIRFISGDHASIRTDSHGGVSEFYTLDSVASSGGDDVIVVGSANDLANRHLGSNFILGGMGKDTIVVSGSVDASGNVSSGLARSEDVILGDNGKIKRTASLLAGHVANLMAQVVSSETANEQGGNDKIIVANGGKVIIAGVGDDTITSKDGDHLLIADNGQIDYDSNNDGILRKMQNSAISQGGNDSVTMGDGFKVVMGGFGTDTITLLASNLGDAIGPITVTGIAAVSGSVDQKRGRSGRYVSGDNAVILFDDQGGLTDITTIDETLSTGDDDSISVGLSPATSNTVDIGTNVLIGGMGDDSISVLGVGSTGSSFDTILGDNGIIERNDYNGLRPTEIAQGTAYALRAVHSTYKEVGGGKDSILTSMGNKVLVGGYDSDTITVTLATAVSSNFRLLSGDNVDISFDRFGGMIKLDTQDTQAVTGGADTILIGSSLTSGQFGTNMVAAGMASDLVLLGGASWDVVLQKLLAGDAYSEDILLGDNGIIERESATAAGEPNYMLQVKSELGDQGASDIIASGSGGKLLIGGFGSDRLTAHDGDHIVAGDNAEVNYDISAKNGILREVKAIETTMGGSDTINLQEGYKVVMGGIGGDSATYDTIDIAATGIAYALGSSITAQQEYLLQDQGIIAANRNEARSLTGIRTVFATQVTDTEAKGRIGRFVVGDNATFSFDTKGGLTDIVTMDVIAATGGRDQIILGAQSLAAGTDLGYQVVMGGMSTDSITIRAQSRSEDYLLGDNGEFHRTASGYGLTSLLSTAMGQGSADSIVSGAGIKMVIGGDSADTVDLATTYLADHADRVLMLGDSGEIRMDQAGGEMLESVTSFLSSPGGIDKLTVGDGDVAFIGGQDADSLTVNSVWNESRSESPYFRIAVGDNAALLFSATSNWESIGRPLSDLTQLQATDVSTTTGSDDSIQIGYAGESAHDIGTAILVGGVGADSLKVSGKQANVLLAGDNVVLRRSAGLTLGPKAIVSQNLELGGGDLLETPTGWHILVGGMAGDTIRAGKGEGVVVGDSGSILYAVDENGNSTALLAGVTSLGLGQGGADSINLGAGTATSDGNHVVVGGYGADVINLVALAGYERLLFGDAADVHYDSFGHLISTTTMDVTAATGGSDRITVGIGGNVNNWPAAGVDLNVVAGGIGDDRIAVNSGGYTVGVISGDNLDYRRGRDSADAYQHRFVDVLMPLLGGNDSILVGGGEQILFGGFGNDSLESRTGTASGERSILFGDSGTVAFDSGLSGRISRAFTTAEEAGGDDTLTVAGGVAYLFAGKGNDSLAASSFASERVAFGDNGQIDWNSNGTLARLQTTGSDALDATMTVDSFSLPLGSLRNEADYASNTSKNYIFGGPGLDTVAAAADPLQGDDMLVPGTGSVSAPGQSGEVISIVLLGSFTGDESDKQWEFLIAPDDYTPQRVESDPYAPVDPGSGSVTGSVVGEAALTEDSLTTASGQLAYPSINGGNAQFTVQSEAVGNYGSFSVNAAGRWSYSLATDLSDPLTAGQVVQDIFIARTTEGSATTVTLTITGANDAPVWSTIAATSYSDSSSSDSFTLESGNWVASDSDKGALLSYGIEGGALSNGLVSKVGSYGTLSIDVSTGAYSYTPVASAINALTADSSESFQITVSDGLASSAATYTIHLTGVNDTPQLATVEEATLSDSALADTFLAIERSLSGSDRDSGQTLSYGIQGGSVSAGVATLLGSYGQLSVDTVSGALRYQADAAAINGLAAGAEVSDSFTVTFSDGTATVTQSFVVRVSGANDLPELSEVVGSMLSDTATEDSFAEISRTLTASDRDSGAALVFGIAEVTASAGVSSKQGSYGVLSVTAEGSLSYLPAASAINALAEGELVSDSFILSLSDGTESVTRLFEVELRGANDSPLWQGEVGDAEYQDSVASDSWSVVERTLLASDVDHGQSISYGVQGGVVSAGVATLAGQYGQLRVDVSSGAVSYLPDSAAINALLAGASGSDSFTLQASDGLSSISRNFTLRVSGSNDQAEIVLGSAGRDSAQLTEDVASSADNRLQASGSLQVGDADSGQAEFATQAVAQGSVWGQLSISASGQWSYRVDNSLSALQSLGQGEQHVDRFQVSSADGSATHLITVTIQGADEPVVISEPTEEEKQQEEQQQQSAAQAAAQAVSSSSSSTTSTSSNGNAPANSGNNSGGNNGLQGQVLVTSSTPSSSGNAGNSGGVPGSATSGSSDSGISSLQTGNKGNKNDQSVNQQPSTVPLTQGASTFYNTAAGTTPSTPTTAQGSGITQSQNSSSYSQTMSQSSSTTGSEGGSSASTGSSGNTPAQNSQPAGSTPGSSGGSNSGGEGQSTAPASSAPGQGGGEAAPAGNSGGDSGGEQPAAPGNSAAPGNQTNNEAAPGNQTSMEPQGEGSQEHAAQLDPLLGTAGMLASLGVVRPRIVWQQEPAASKGKGYRRLQSVAPRG